MKSTTAVSLRIWCCNGERTSTEKDQSGRDSGRDETEEERLDRNLGELLQELRVALPGVQVLFAFLLAVPFQQDFAKITELPEGASTSGPCCCTAIAAVLLISPSAYHRVTFRYQQKHRLVFFANRFSIAGLVFLALAMTGAIMLITDVLFGTTATVVTAASRPSPSASSGSRCRCSGGSGYRRRRSLLGEPESE